MRTQVIEVVDEYGALLCAQVTFEVRGREVVWSAEFPGTTLAVPLTGTAGSEETMPAALQAAVLRWGITSGASPRFS
ncbi:hypothetical protein ABIE56_000396 [Luteibacter sp. 621]|uniref:hypothetical protein n=1 Tax=Luteibacter sp. 621 TaxID=3373916 RepID=UPI003D24A93D